MQAAKASIAVVDDDPSVRKALSRLIKAAGYSVSVYQSGEDFLRSGLVKDADCLILDVHLPGMNGLELQEDLMQMGPHCPVVFISAFSDEKARTQAVRNGALEFLPKPLDSERLLEVIARSLDADTAQ